MPRRVIWLLTLLAVCAVAAGPGFRTTHLYNQHFKKHGAEFGKISKADYLRFAQELRDARVGGSILEAKRKDGVISRFDKQRGWFGAYDRDRTIRTFFIPAAGESYFWRQAGRTP